MYDLRELFKGVDYVICALRHGNGRIPSLEFQKEQVQSRRDKIESIIAYMRSFADDSASVFKLKHAQQLTGQRNRDIYEFKKIPIRVFFFFDGKKVILTNGIIKKDDETDQLEIDRAIAARNGYLAQNASRTRRRK